MQFHVRPDSSIPIYEQIISQVIFSIAAEDVAVGELIPSVRDLSQQLIVNANTVGRAFQELERMGVLETRRGLGMAVSADGPKLCRERRKESVRERVRDAVREAAAAGLTPDDLHQLVTDEWPRITAGRNGHSKSNH